MFAKGHSSFQIIIQYNRGYFINVMYPSFLNYFVPKKKEHTIKNLRVSHIAHFVLHPPSKFKMYNMT